MASKQANGSQLNGFSEQTLIPETLWLYERALAATSCGIVISDARQPKNPIIYCNQAFLDITGYSRQEVLGRNCKFLQGEGTEEDVIEQIRQSIKTHQECHVVLKNYRKDGTLFWNELTISPVKDSNGQLTHFIGVQTDVTQRKQVERNLRRTNALRKAQQEADIDGVIVVDEQGAVVDYNQRFCQMWQIPEEILKLKNREKRLEYMFSLLADPLPVLSKVERLEENPSSVMSDEISLKSGQVFERYSAPVLSPDGEYYGRTWSFRDITERKQGEEKLRQQAEREKLLTGMNQRIRQSLKLEEVLKTAVEEVRQFLACDRTVLYRFNPDWSGTIVVESVDSKRWRISLGENIEDTCFQKTKAHLYQQGRVSAIEDIHNSSLSQCHRELLEQFQVRANLVVPILQGDNLWGLLIAHQCSGVRKWLESDISLLKELGVQLSVAIQQAALFEQVAEELKVRKVAEAALRESEAALREKTTQLEITLKQLQQAQIQLVQTEKMSSLGQLVAGVAHEINNPVTFIYGNIAYANQYTNDLLKLVQLYRQHYCQPSPEIEELSQEIELDFMLKDFPKLLNSMNIGVNRIRQIVLSLKNFSRLDQAERKSADIHEGIDNTLLILQHRFKPEAANIQLVKEYGELPAIDCYPGELNQVFLNILNNAIDALERYEPSSKNSQPYTKTIKIATEAKNCSPKASSCESNHNCKSVFIRITDNGPGMAEEVTKKIFDPFFTTKVVGEGTGLGLSISYQIVVEKHGGSLECHSELGKGTEFLIEIALQMPEAKAAGKVGCSGQAS
ncbi:MAG: PAS domain-containing protein [Coleofasciculaceae cyanobacterium]